MTDTAFVVKWRSVDEKPDDRQICHIRGEGAFLLMGLPYIKEFDGWVDLFATSEAGQVYDKKNGITAWVPEAELDFDSEYPEPKDD